MSYTSRGPDAEYIITNDADAHQHRTEAVGAVEIRMHVVAPVIRLTVGDARPDGLTIVYVLALGVFQLADLVFGI